MNTVKVGQSADPETQGIERYDLGNLILWDTPGLGDGEEADKRHTRAIVEKLAETDDEDRPLIDLVLVILDASSKDLGTSYQLINKVIIPALNDDSERILIALNQADIAMRGGNHWNYEENRPDDTLKAFLDEKVKSIANRIKEATGLSVSPIYYCSGYKENGDAQMDPYNLSKLLYYIVSKIPAEKRVAFVGVLNDDPDMWEDDDGEENYKVGFFTKVGDSIKECADYAGEELEACIGWPGKVIGSLIGGTFGLVVGVIDAILDH